MEEFIQNFRTSKHSGNQWVGISDTKDKEQNDYQTIILEPENEEIKEREKSQSDKIDWGIDKYIPVFIIVD